MVGGREESEENTPRAEEPVQRSETMLYHLRTSKWASVATV